MKVLYACSFDISGCSGKNRATRQKLTELKKLVDGLIVVHSRRGGLLRIPELVYIELKCLYLLVKNKPDVFVSRGYVGLLSIIFCWILGGKSVREVHADQVGEIPLLDKGIISKVVLYFLAHYSVIMDRLADARIFNHPWLLQWYDKKYGVGDFDIACYNGFSNEKLPNFDKEYILKKYGLAKGFRYLVFTGSASKWHGVEYLVELQKRFLENGDDFRVVCAGGKVSKEIDPESVLINISPLDDAGCDEVISIAYACLLPVKNNRVSPGSPLKLYDYIRQEKYVIVQDGMAGYSDEVMKYGRGVCVDFENIDSVLNAIDCIDFNARLESDKIKFSWRARMNEWLKMFKKLIED